MEFTMYKTEIETDLIQHVNVDNMLLTLDYFRESESGIHKTSYYILTLSVDGKPIYKPIAESNPARIYSQYAMIKYAMNNGR